jgi:hypothetical protein
VKRVVIAAAMAGAFLLASPSTAGAWCSFCEWDPIVLIVTPAGHIVPVYDSVWTSSPLYPGLPLASYQVSRVYDQQGQPETLVDMTISTPTGLLLRYQVMDEVTTGLLGSGQVLARSYGWSGSPVHLKFVLHEA